MFRMYINLRRSWCCTYSGGEDGAGLAIYVLVLGACIVIPLLYVYMSIFTHISLTFFKWASKKYFS